MDNGSGEGRNVWDEEPVNTSLDILEESQNCRNVYAARRSKKRFHNKAYS
jgi:hypothetical protein